MDTVTLTQAEYQDLIDSRDHAIAMRAVAGGAMPTLDDAALDAYLQATTPLAFWRRHRGRTQAALAAAAGISQGFLAQIETGERVGTASVLLRLARALDVRIEDLIAE